MSNEPTAHQTIVGGEKVSVVFRDGTARDVFVAQLRPSQLPAYCQAEIKNEHGPLELVTGLTFDEIDDLTLESLEALLEADLRQNFTYARRYEKRRAETTARQFEAMRASAPDQYAKLTSAIEKHLSQSLASLPELQPPAAAGASPQK